jgi:DNA-binding NtrC family response regulator
MASILIIDDDYQVLRALRLVLEADGHNVHDAPDGKTALRRFAGDPTDLVITDIYMPEMDGLDFLERVRETFPEARIIAMSGGGILPRGQTLEHAITLGAAAILQKPFKAPELREAIRVALGRTEEGREESAE